MKLLPLDNTPSCSIYNQYLDTNIHKLIDNLCTRYDTTLLPFINTFKELADLSIATGRVLDNKGKLLGFNRYITFNDPLNVVREDTEGITQYKKLMNDYKECRLSDDAYRTILMLIAQTKSTVASVETLTQVVSTVVGAEIFVDDYMNMEYITYYFLDRIPGWLEVVIENYDVLPRPAGMATKYISSISRFFGFLFKYPVEDRIQSSKIVTAFWKARFPVINTPQQVTYLPWQKNLYRLPWVLKNITTDDYHDILKDLDKKVKNELDSLALVLNKEVKLQNDAVTHDRKYMYNYHYTDPKSTIAYLYTQATAEDWDYAESYYWQAQRSALESYLNNIDNLNNVGYMKLHEIYKTDLRSLLYYDKKTGWYYYEAPDENGNFDVNYLAELYQDDDNLWYPQSLRSRQLQSSGVELRASDYTLNYKTITLHNTPFLSKYQTIYDNASNEGKHNLRDLVDNLHAAVEIYHYCNALNKFSFRAVLDFEYRNLSIFNLLDNYEDRSESGSVHDKRLYYRFLYGIYKNYVGEAKSYSDRYSDKNSRIYKHLQHLRFMRRKVKELGERLTELYNANYRLYNSGVKISGIDSSIYTVISTMRQVATQEHFNDWERSRWFGKNDEGYSAINIDNNAVRYYKEEARKKWQHNQRGIDMHKTAQSSCYDASNYCPDKDKSTAAGALQWCFLKQEATDNPNSGNTWSWGQGYWLDDVDDGWFSDKWRYCQSDGGYNNHALKWANIQSGYVEGYEREKTKAIKEYDALVEEEYLRTPITENKSLRALMKEYSNYDPNIDYRDLDREIDKINQNPDLTFTIY